MSVKYFRDPEYGDLGVLEFDVLPFVCKRVYWIGKFVNGAVRGNHAHKTLRQAFIVLRGEVNFSFYKGNEKTDVTLTEHDDFLLVNSGTWRSFYSQIPESILLVACDQEFNEKDYIRNWDEYLDWYKKNES